MKKCLGSADKHCQAKARDALAKAMERESEVAQSCPTLCSPMGSSLHQIPPSMGFPRPESWSGLPFPSLRNLPNPGIEPRSPESQVDPVPSEPPGKPRYMSQDSIYLVRQPFKPKRDSVALK